MQHSTQLSPPSQTSTCIAKSLTAQQRRHLAVHALAGIQPVTSLAGDFQVSRKFVYRQAETAEQALDQAFAASSEKAAEKVIFHLPVTKDWLQQLVLGLALHCHSSFRGIQGLLGDVFDTSLSLGTIHNILHNAVAEARQANAQPDLSRVRIGAHDEIFQNDRPALVGIDVETTYCYLLQLEKSRDADTWARHLRELKERGLMPEATVADGGRGLRAAQTQVWPDVPCRGDVFHALYDVGKLVSYLDNRAYDAIDARDREERRMARARSRGQGKTRSRTLGVAREKQEPAIELAEDVALLARWLRDDILAVVGPDYATRRGLFDFIIAELDARQSQCAHRIGPVVRELRNQRDDLLLFAAELDKQLVSLAGEYQVPPSVTRELLLLTRVSREKPAYWQRELELRRQVGGRFFQLQKAVSALAKETVRASSMVENLNGRLRGYFFLRRHLGPEYLDLLRFFLNHRRFPRSAHPERVGKSPAELLTGDAHPHWLELLGYQRFQRN